MVGLRQKSSAHNVGFRLIVPPYLKNDGLEHIGTVLVTGDRPCYVPGPVPQSLIETSRCEVEYEHSSA
jgi:hypothetical protein